MGSRQKLGRPAIGRRRTTTATTTNKMELGRYSIFYRRIATVRIAVLMDRLPFLFLLLFLRQEEEWEAPCHITSGQPASPAHTISGKGERGAVHTLHSL